LLVFFFSQNQHVDDCNTIKELKELLGTQKSAAVPSSVVASKSMQTQLELTSLLSTSSTPMRGALKPLHSQASQFSLDAEEEQQEEQEQPLTAAPKNSFLTSSMSSPSAVVKSTGTPIKFGVATPFTSANANATDGASQTPLGLPSFSSLKKRANPQENQSQQTNYTPIGKRPKLESFDSPAIAFQTDERDSPLITLQKTPVIKQLMSNQFK
jgi:hypothetical protein